MAALATKRPGQSRLISGRGNGNELLCENVEHPQNELICGMEGVYILPLIQNSLFFNYINFKF
jgi:hypothetical protein